MTESFLHGVEVIELSTGPRPISTVASSIIGLIGTAPSSAAAVAANFLFGLASLNNAVVITAKTAGAAGNLISLALINPNTPTATATCTVSGSDITVNLGTDANSGVTTTATALATLISGTPAATALVNVANATGSSGAGVLTPAAKTYLSAGADEPFPIDTPVMVNSLNDAAALGAIGNGSLPGAIRDIFDQTGATIVVVRVTQTTADANAATVTAVIGGVNVSTGAYTGVQAFLASESKLGLVPRILCAPGFTEQVTKATTVITGAAVTAALVAVADRLRAVVIADGPNTNDADAIAYRGLFGSSRLFIVDPKVMVYANGITTAQPASGRVAGLIAGRDASDGFWWSPSNLPINGIVGVARPVDFVLGDPNSRANYLNANSVATIIRKDGYRLWGNRSASSDPKWMFLSVRRTADMINDSIMRAHMWAVDQNITATYLDDVTGEVNAYLRHLREIGAIIDGKCWADPLLNTPDQIALGRVYFDFDFAPPYPAEHIQFRSLLNQNYLTELVPQQ